MTTNMSRRFSTMELPTPTYQKDMTNDVRLKLAKVRARSRSFCAPSSSSTASTELKTKKSSQLPRSSVTALTTSAKAKQRQPRSNGRNSTTTTESSNPVHTLNKRRQSVCSTKPTHHDAATSSSSKTARQPQRNKSSRTTTTKKAHSGISRDNTEQDIMIKFFESDSDEDDLFFRHKSEPAAEMDQDQLQQQQRCQRRTTMPPRLIVSDRRLSSSYSSEQTSVPTNNADKNHDQSMWAELQELKSRLAKLEVQTPTETANNKKLSSICSPPITRPSSITSVVSSPHSPLADSACSILNNKETKSHPQKLLQDTVLHLENHFQQDDDPNNSVRNTAFMDTLVDLVAETITINQTLNNFDSQQQRHVSGNFINNITTLQKNSERQINLLADALQSLMVYRQQGSHQHQPVSPPLSQSIMDSESVSPKSTKPYQTTSSLNNYSPLSVRQPRLSNQQCAYPYYLDNPIQSYTDDTLSQHSNLLTATFTNTLSRHQQRQQNRKSAISSSSSAAAASSNLPLYIKYADLEQPSTKQVPQQQQTHEQPLSSRPVSGILHQQHHTSYQQQQQQQQSYYPSSIADQHRQHSLSQSTIQPVASARVHRLLSMYDSMLKPVATGAAGTNSSPPMSPPSIQQHQYSHLQHHQDQHSYIDYRHH